MATMVSIATAREAVRHSWRRLRHSLHPPPAIASGRPVDHGADKVTWCCVPLVEFGKSSIWSERTLVL